LSSQIQAISAVANIYVIFVVPQRSAW
jgi:hypothetical protein